MGGISIPNLSFIFIGVTMIKFPKKLKITEADHEFYIPKKSGRDIVYKGDIVMYHIERKEKRGKI